MNKATKIIVFPFDWGLFYDECMTLTIPTLSLPSFRSCVCIVTVVSALISAVFVGCAAGQLRIERAHRLDGTHTLCSVSTQHQISQTKQTNETHIQRHALTFVYQTAFYAHCAAAVSAVSHQQRHHHLQSWELWRYV